MGYISLMKSGLVTCYVPLPLLTLLLLLAPAAKADTDLQIQAAQIVGYGIFKAASQSSYRGFTRSSIAADTVRGVQFTDFTNEIPGVLGTNFGFEYVVNTTPRGQLMRIRSIIKFPEPGLQTPGGRLYPESIEVKDVRIGERNLHGYGFDEEWEIVPGEWVFEIWYKKARIIKKTFTVVEVVEEAPDSSVGQ